MTCVCVKARLCVLPLLFTWLPDAGALSFKLVQSLWMARRSLEKEDSRVSRLWQAGLAVISIHCLKIRRVGGLCSRKRTQMIRSHIWVVSGQKISSLTWPIWNLGYPALRAPLFLPAVLVRRCCRDGSWCSASSHTGVELRGPTPDTQARDSSTALGAEV